MVLREYMARMDGQDPEKALALLEPGFRFLLALPDGERTGESRADFAAYIAGRNAGDRVHEIVRYSVDQDLETAYGFVVEAGTPTGAFLSAAVVSPSGLMARYQSYFTPVFDLVDRP
ncbi:nuclear transport factor 2 family protein [Streptomyces sp. NPDC050546]|uniref:nuclear transport factor 2 family protein n=1 Tax=Streptomyces sp. NPDC050546 TaxID=3365628 RepID=UPI0037B64B09